MAFKIGMVTIGQSPRVDLVPEIRKFIPRNVQIIEKGALDGLTLSEVRKLKPRGRDDELLCSRMKDGSQVEFGRSHILRRMQEKISELNREGVEIVTLLCGGKFPGLKSRKMLIFPDKLLFGVLSSVVIHGKLGVMIPLEDQVEYGREYFEEISFKVIAAAASPYSGEMKEITKAARILSRKEIDLIVMYCFGYNLKMKKIVEDITKKPVCLLRSLLAVNLREFIR